MNKKGLTPDTPPTKDMYPSRFAPDSFSPDVAFGKIPQTVFSSRRLDNAGDMISGGRMRHKGVEREYRLEVFGPTTSLSTGDGKTYLHIGKMAAGMDLIYAFAGVVSSSEGETNVQIHNLNKEANVFSTALTIDAGERDSSTALTPVVIDQTKDDVLENHWYRIDVDGTSGAPAAGLYLTLGFKYRKW
jgi:hypothetical protein